jgi:release factor glutamine methyltransferase
MTTVADYVFAGAERLRSGAHPGRALQDAERLLMHVLGKDRAWMLACWRDEIDTARSIPYHAAIERRRIGEPIQYIVGDAEFYGLPFRVTGDVLIPRPETEHAVEKVLELAAGFAAPRIVDVGAGSGAIAVAVAHKLPHAAVTAIDLSPAALALARENAQRNGIERIRFLEGDLLAPTAGEPFDIVVSNPPYVAQDDRASLAVEVRDYEPAMALFAGEEGLTIYRRLIPQAFAVLAPGGWLVLEIGCGQQASVAALLEEAGFREIAFTADLQGIPRVGAARRP